jgi:hypothetical protein
MEKLEDKDDHKYVATTTHSKHSEYQNSIPQTVSCSQHSTTQIEQIQEDPNLAHLDDNNNATKSIQTNDLLSKDVMMNVKECSEDLHPPIAQNHNPKSRRNATPNTPVQHCLNAPIAVNSKGEIGKHQCLALLPIRSKGSRLIPRSPVPHKMKQRAERTNGQYTHLVLDQVKEMIQINDLDPVYGSQTRLDFCQTTEAVQSRAKGKLRCKMGICTPRLQQ